MLWDIVEGGNGLVAVGDNGRILHSSDGNEWEAQPSGVEAWLVAIAFAQGRYVTVGDQGAILISSNGLSWRPATHVPTTKRLNNVAYGNGHWIAVGEEGTILISDDNAENWETVASPTTKWLRALALNPVAVSRNVGHEDAFWIASGESSEVLISENGRDWRISTDTLTSAAPLPNTEVLLPQQPFDFFTAFDRAIRYRTTFVAIGSLGLCELRYGEARFWAPGFENFEYFKPDHVEWKVAPLHLRTSTAELHWRSAASFDDVIVLAGENGTLATASSVQLSQLTLHDVGTNANLVGSGYGLDSLFVVGSDETIIRSSALNSSSLTNLSTRGRVSTNQTPMVAGIVIDGGSKRLLVRAVGPTLAEFGIINTLPNPQLEVRDSAGELIAQNHGWFDATEPQKLSQAADRVGAFKLAHGEDSALLIENQPEQPILTATVHGGEDSGVSLVEFYDASSVGLTLTSPGHIMNLSTRGYVGRDEDVLVAGFTIEGDSALTVLIRGIGPSLANFGVPSPLADPVLSLTTAEGNLLARNAHWSEADDPVADDSAMVAIQQTALAVGAFPLVPDSLDAALLVTLVPGHYTVTLSGAQNEVGNGLVEIYRVLR